MVIRWGFLDVKSLFTKVPLDRTIQLVTKKVYEKHEVSTNITKQKMKGMLILCTKTLISLLMKRFINEQMAQQWYCH